MSIVKPKPKAQAVQAAEFIDGAPDAKQQESVKRKGVIRGKKEQISLTIAPELLAELDALTGPMGQSRASLIGLAVYRFIEQERH